MFKGIRDLSAAILSLAETCVDASRSNSGSRLRHDELAARVVVLESTLAVRLAEAEASLIDAEAKKRVARNAENRLHTLEAKRAAREEDPFGDLETGAGGIEEQHDQLQDFDATANGAHLPALHQGLDVPRRLTRSELANNRLTRGLDFE